MSDVAMAAGMQAGGDIITGGLGFVGGLINNESQRKENRRMEDLSNTAVQRRAADMKKAGINKLMAAGQPASTPQLTAPTGLGTGVEKAGQAIGQIPKDINAMNLIQAQTTQIQAQSEYQKTLSRILQGQEESEIAAKNATNTATAKNAMNISDAETRALQLGNDFKQIEVNIKTQTQAPEIQRAFSEASSAQSKAEADKYMPTLEKAHTAIETAKAGWQKTLSEADAMKADAAAKMMVNELVKSNAINDTEIARAQVEFQLLTSRAGQEAIATQLAKATYGANVSKPYIENMVKALQAASLGADIIKPGKGGGNWKPWQNN